MSDRARDAQRASAINVQAETVNCFLFLEDEGKNKRALLRREETPPSFVLFALFVWFATFPKKAIRQFRRIPPS